MKRSGQVPRPLRLAPKSVPMAGLGIVRLLIHGDAVGRTGRMAITSSLRGVLYASRGSDFAEAARRAASDLRAEMRQALASAGG